MLYDQLYKSKQFFFVLIKLGIVSLAFYFIYLKLTSNSKFSFDEFLLKNVNFNPKNVFFLLILTIFNWLFEILKWQTLVSSIKKISFISALEQCLGSLTASLITPNRIGEYGAKAIYYEYRYRNKILLLNLISNVLQLSVTLVFGGIGFLLFTSKYYLNLDFYRLLWIVIIAGIIITFLGFFIWKSNISIKGFSFKKVKTFIVDFPRRKLVLSFLMSLFRYAFFSFQFYFLLIIFNVSISYLEAMEVITSMYLLASIIPSITIFDVFIKGSVAVFLFSFLGLNEFTILTIVSLMWGLNFALPGIVGSYYVLRFNLPKSNF